MANNIPRDEFGNPLRSPREGIVETPMIEGEKENHENLPQTTPRSAFHIKRRRGAFYMGNDDNEVDYVLDDETRQW
jgi:hypothetical protein